MKGISERIVETAILMVIAVTAGLPTWAAETVQLTINGQVRAFLLERPATREPRPTTIMLHGVGGSSKCCMASVEVRNAAWRRWKFEGHSTVDGPWQASAKRGFVAVFPQGRGAGGAPDDVSLIKA